MKPSYQIISLFPQLFEDFLKYGVIGQAFKSQLFELNMIQPRDFTQDVHKTIDDRPFGGGDGMLMMASPLAFAIDQARSKSPKAPVIYLSAQGERFNATMAKDFAKLESIIFLCGRYGGVDQRLIRSKVDREICVGDFVVSGGELPLMMILDACVRFLPGALGHQASAYQDSFENSLLEAPAFTRPQEIWGMKVPEVLLSGDHSKIHDWRKLMGWAVTATKRPDLISNSGNFLTEAESKKLLSLLTSLSDLELADLGVNREAVLAVMSKKA